MSLLNEEHYLVDLYYAYIRILHAVSMPAVLWLLC